MSYVAHSDSESCDLGVYKKLSGLESTHANEGAKEIHHIGERITCLLRLHDDFTDFSLISLIFTQWLA